MTHPIDTSPEAIAALLDGVTTGPWRVEYNHGTTRLIMGDSCEMCDETYYPWTPKNLKDWAFFAAARDLVPALAAERDRLAAENDRLREALRMCPPTSNPSLTAGQHVEAINAWWKLYARAALKGETP